MEPNELWKLLADRVAQMVVKQLIEPELEPVVVAGRHK
jgi:hypothetical protein